MVNRSPVLGPSLATVKIEPLDNGTAPASPSPRSSRGTGSASCSSRWSSGARPRKQLPQNTAWLKDVLE